MKTSRIRQSSLLLLVTVLFSVLGLRADDAKPLSIPKPAKEWIFGDPIRFGEDWMTLDVQERLRYENRENTFDFNGKGNVLSITDDSYLLQRLRIGLRIQPNDWINSYLQMQDAREIGSTRPDDPGFFGSEGDQNASLRQANVAIGNFKEYPLSLTAGRQELSYGEERLVGTFDWNNLGRVFDGLKFRFQQETWNLDVFAVMPVQEYTKHFDVPDSDDKFFGLYYQTKEIPVQTTELYAFYRNKTNNDAGFPMGGYTIGTDKLGDQVGTQAGDYTTLGTRIKSVPGKLGAWDYGLEVSGQVGSLIANSADTNTVDSTTRRRNLMAMATHVAGGYTLEGAEKIRFGLEYDYASGDSDPNNASTASFQNLFPTNHKFYGYMDLFAWRNMHDARVQFNITPVEKLGLQMDYHAFWIAETSDAWFRANAVTPVRGVGAGPTLRANADPFAGQEIDFTANYPLTKWMKLLVGYSHFFAGPYLHDTGAASDANFTYVQTTVSF